MQTIEIYLSSKRVLERGLPPLLKVHAVLWRMYLEAGMQHTWTAGYRGTQAYSCWFNVTALESDKTVYKSSIRSVHTRYGGGHPEKHRLQSTISA